MRSVWGSLLLALVPVPGAAQTESDLRAHFEGMRVRVTLEMPATSQGVDVYPGVTPLIDYSQYAARIRTFGAAYVRGDDALVTKVKLKGDHIEFHLGAGGYGPWDDSGAIPVPPPAPKTEREKNLEEDIAKATDPAVRRKLREEMDALRRAREREDARNRLETARAQEIRDANIHQRRLESGSRFNLQYRSAVPARALTPESVREALGEYLEFPAPRGRGPAGGQDDLRKGLTVEEVDAMLGRPEAISERKEGVLTVSTSIYRSANRRITAEFVEGILIRFSTGSP